MIVKLEQRIQNARRLFAGGKEREGWAILTACMDLIEPSIKRRIRARKFNVINTEEALADIKIIIFDEWVSRDEKHRFWEVAFGQVLNCTIISALNAYNRRVGHAVEYQMPDNITTSGKQDDWFARQTSGSDFTERLMERDFLRRALAALTENERQAILLFYVEQVSQKEIARRFETTDRTIRNWIGAGLRKLREAAA